MIIGSGLRRLVRSSVIVNLDTGRAFEGILWQNIGDFLVLREATVYERGTRDGKPAVGEIVIDRDRVEYLQVVQNGSRS